MTKPSTSNHLRRCATAVAGLVVSLVSICAAAPGAFAMRLTPPDDSGTAPVVHAGTPTWEMALIAIGIAIAFGLVSLSAVAVLRGRSTAKAQRALS